MEFRRVDRLPPYAFAEIDRVKAEHRRAGLDVVDLAFGNPDLPSPPAAVEKLREAALNPRNHRYSASRGLPNLRAAICELYARRFGVELDPETQALTTIGAKEGLVHLLWTLADAGDTVVVPTPTYPIHRYAPLIAGASVAEARVDADDPVGAIREAFAAARPRPRAIVASFPHNPTTATVDAAGMQALVDFAREQEVLLVHDFAYADLCFDGYRPPSLLAAEGAADVAVELYSLTKSFSMAGWRVGFALGNREALAALARLKSYLDYGTFQPIQIASIVALREADEYSEELCAIYRSRRDALCNGLARVGWEVPRPRATMFVWAPLPRSLAHEPSHEVALRLIREGGVAASPGAGFGPGGEGHLRFALIENEHRIGQAVRGIGRVLRAAEVRA
ncbi:MAG TPA: aminotransferase class I/II-fold pyridoxal phosphate-dependent enzyme [Gaiellaceae bacterium]|nr:aminotransferase class I/II-fold pyridoxal phosphate-dependent enzyme [Gaiellaceae bacterium]